MTEKLRTVLGSLLVSLGLAACASATSDPTAGDPGEWPAPSGDVDVDAGGGDDGATTDPGATGDAGAETPDAAADAPPADDGAATTPDAGTQPQSAKYPDWQEGGDIAAGVAHLNEYRAALGLSQVTLDATTSVGCEGHLDYLIWEQQRTGQTVLRHDEPDHSNPYYSPSNEQAGKDSDIAWGQDQNGGQSFGAAVDTWVNGIYHRHPLLDPGLQRVGAASKNGFNCLNYRSNGNTQPVKAAHAITWPADGMTDVPRTFMGDEGPCPTMPNDPMNSAGQKCQPAGFIPSLVLYGWGTYQQSVFQSVSSVTMTAIDTHASVPLLAWYGDGVAGHDPIHGYMQDEIALVPQMQLAANTAYRVDVDAVIGGSPTHLSWSFTTGSRDR